MNSLSPTEEKWNITTDIERNFWNYNIINVIINPPKECNNCKSTKIYITNGDTLLNPLARCSKCKKKFI